MHRLKRIVLDSSGAVSDLCVLGAKYVTDKSPYNNGAHRHPYTAVYDMMFNSKRYDNIVFGEIGIAFNASIRMWREYFSNATIFGFEFREDLIEAATKECITNAYFSKIDVGDPAFIAQSLNQVGRKFDIIIDDSTHLFEHQANIIPAALPFMKPGGMLIIEDVFRGWSEHRYHEVLSSSYPYLSSALFIETNHELRFSEGDQEPYYNNDKLLVLHRNCEPAPSMRTGLSISEIPLLTKALA